MFRSLGFAAAVLFLAAGCGSSSTGRECESLDEFGGTCVAGTGGCAAFGTLQCSEDGTTLVCSAQAGSPVDELCDGLDNDCDGKTDEELTPEPVDSAVGVCAGLVKTCSGGAGWADPDLASVEGYEADEKACDGKDNDCDGETDEDLIGGPRAECKGAGVCGAGVKAQCVAGAWECGYGEIEGYEEPEASCDGLDNDCDEQTDEELAAGPGGVCPDQGVCAGLGSAACVAGAWECDLAAVPGHEEPEAACDGLDNDCDGKTDEALADLPADPACVGSGVCSVGAASSCVAGAWSCNYAVIPGWQAFETLCDQLDNDCDGETDEGWACSGATCEGIPAGSVKCTADLGGLEAPAVDAEGTVYVTADVGGGSPPVLVALSPADCSPMWQFTPPATELLNCHAPVIRFDGNLLFSCNAMFSDVSSPIYVVSPEGKLLSTINLVEGVFPSGLAVRQDGTLYFGEAYCCGMFYAYNPDGSLKWQLDTKGSEFDGTPAIGPDGTIYAGTRKYQGSPEEKVYAISDNGASGSIKWAFSPPEDPGQYDTNGIMVNAWPAVNGGMVYVGIDGQLPGQPPGQYSTTLYALDAATGKESWHYSALDCAAGLNNSVLIGKEGQVFMVSGHFGTGNDDPTTMLLHAVSPDGAALFDAPAVFLELDWNAIPALGADGNLYVAATDHAWCIDGQTGDTLWSIDIKGAGGGTAIGPTGALYFLTTTAFYAVCSESGGLAASPWPKVLHDAANTGSAGF